MKDNILKPEILAPVGGEEQLKAAVRTGAGAVYFGLQNFNARRNAENFAGEGLEDTIKYCHTHGVKVYITINTLVKDSEISAMHEAVDTAAMAGADAIIIQDYAVASYVRKRWPGLKMFASTQMVCHNAEGVRLLQSYGFDRVVLARELSLEEIRSVIAETGVQAEIFVHGAHCMGVSGACYMSAVIGQRSGNRGLCAQPCRLDWKYGGRDYVLSLKDLSYIQHINELAEAGVVSLKIEGRMKRAEYVAASVTACKNAIEGKPVDMETLRAVFSRSGFTDGHLTGKRGRDMFGYRTREDVVAAPGVYDKLSALYTKEPSLCAVDMMLSVTAGQPATLTVTDGENWVSVSGDVPQKAKTLPLSEEYAARSLGKTGGTIYTMNSLELSADPGLMLPASSLNALRRSALEQLDDIKGAKPYDFEAAEREGRGGPAAAAEDEISRLQTSVPMGAAVEHPLRYRFETADQIFDTDGTEALILPVTQIELHPELLEAYADRLYAEMPFMLWPGSGAAMKKRLAALQAKGLKHVTADNDGAVQIASELGLCIHGGYGLNILNSISLREHAAFGLADACLSMELSFANMRKLKPCLPVGFIAYGRLPLMKFRACPVAAGKDGCKGCSGLNYLTDRTGEQFPLLCRERQYSELHNCLPLYLGDKPMPEVSFKTLYFTIESKDQCRNIAAMFKDGITPGFRRTSGLYSREIQ